MEEALLSLIIPAYNAEKYILETLQSICSGTYRKLEVLVIDDGSKDTTAQLVTKFAESDPRVRLYTVKNGGPAAARNFGLGQLSPESKYLAFCDADDSLLPDFLALEVETAEKNDAQMVLGGFAIVNPDGSRKDYCEPAAALNRENLGAALTNLYKANLLNQVWAKLYRTDFVQEHQIRFPLYRWGEDRIFVFDCLEHVQRLCVVPQCGYQYIMHAGDSLITSFYAIKPAVCTEVDRRMQGLCKELGVEDNGFFRYMFVKSIFSCVTNLSSPTCHLSAGEKKAYVRGILTEETVERCHDVEGGTAAKLICAVLRSRNVGLTMAAGKSVAALGKAAPKLLQKIKHRK